MPSQRSLYFFLLWFLAGCTGPKHAVLDTLIGKTERDAPPSYFALLCDTSVGSPCGAEELRRTTAVYLPRLTPGSEIALLRLDDTYAAVRVAEYKPPALRSTSEAAKELYASRIQQEALPYLLDAAQPLLQLHPHTSLLAAGIDVIARSAPAGYAHTIILITDGKDQNLGECGPPPTTKEFLARLDAQRLLEPGSLRETRVVFAYMNPRQPGENCGPDTRRAAIVRDLWTAAIQRAGGQCAIFPAEPRFDPSVATAMWWVGWLPVFGAIPLAVRRQARRDARAGKSQKATVLARWLGLPKPAFNAKKNDEHRALTERIAPEKLSRIADDLHGLSQIIVQHPSVLITIPLLLCAGAFDWVGNNYILGIIGISGFQRPALAGVWTGANVIGAAVITAVARKPTKRPWERHLLLGALITGNLFIAAVLAITRLGKVLASGEEPVLTAVTSTIIIALVSGAAPWVFEWLADRLRIIAPTIKLRWLSRFKYLVEFLKQWRAKRAIQRIKASHEQYLESREALSAIYDLAFANEAARHARLIENRPPAAIRKIGGGR